MLPVKLFYTGVAIGHVYQAIWEGDMAPNNFGMLLLLTIAEIFLLPCLYMFARAQMNAVTHRRENDADDQKILAIGTINPGFEQYPTVRFPG